MAGGLIGAVAGPNLAAATRDVLAEPFAAAYIALAGVALLAMAVLAGIRFPAAPARQAGDGGRPLWEIARQPAFVVAAAAGALAYGVMNLLMASTPIAMQQCGLPFSDAALVLEWHVFGMFAPGFFTGHLIKRFGTLPIMGVGVVLNLACIAVALTGIELRHFGLALLLLGVGWNFLFTGSTTLSMQTYTPQERDKVQGVLNFMVFATLALSSFSSGVLVTTQGWQWLNVGSLVPIVLTGLGLVWLTRRQRAARLGVGNTR
jgi:MFS family permease